jgi:hypothetical protein
MPPRHRAPSGRSGFWWCVAALSAVLIVAPRAQRAPEYAVKAAYLYNFTRFITWPSDAFEGASAPFGLCVFGDDPFGPELDRTFAGERVGTHPVRIERIRTLDALGGCRVIFVPEAEASHTADVLRRAAPTALTIGEADGFLERGGMIRLVLDGGHVRFDLNAAQFQAHRLVPSSKLLRVARRTVGEGGR